MINSIVEKATRIAARAHKDQIRKGDDTPYITPYVVHPIMVALKLQKYGFGDEVIAAALCHDVLEDTDYPAEELHQELGNESFRIIKAVTADDSLPWEEKKLQYIETVRQGPVGAKAVCVADKIHNLECIFIAYDVQGDVLWSKFNRGKEQKIWFESLVLKMLKETWDHPMIEDYESLLEKEKALK